MNRVYYATQSFLKNRSLGHGAPGILACLWLENSLSAYYPQYTRDKDGLHRLIIRFGVPGGFPRHVPTTTPPCPSLTMHIAT